MPTLIDLFCGRGGWTIAAMKRGWRCVGIDCTDHGYPGTLLKRSLPMTTTELLALGGDLITASPPCEDFARCHLPWLRTVANPCTKLLTWSVQTAAEISTPMIVECSRFAGWHVPGGRYIRPYTWWGDVPALMPLYTHNKDRARGHSGLAKEVRAARAAMIPEQIAGWIIDYYAQALNAKARNTDVRPKK